MKDRTRRFVPGGRRRPRERLRERRQGRLRGIRLAAVVVAVMALDGCREKPSGPTVTLHADGEPIRVSVELARTSEEQSRGLMWRDQLDENAGMLFVFKRARPRSFWMKNTPLPLDIIYIDSDGGIVSIAENTKPYSERSIPSRGSARYVLEVNGGFCQRHGVAVGTRVELPAELADDS